MNGQLALNNLLQLLQSYINICVEEYDDNYNTEQEIIADYANDIEEEFETLSLLLKSITINEELTHQIKNLPKNCFILFCKNESDYNKIKSLLKKRP